MEHIVQFAIGIDDTAIVQNITKYAEKQIKEDLMKKIESNIEYEIFEYKDTGWYGPKKKCGLQEWVRLMVAGVIRDREDEIVEMAAERLANKLSRTKAIKDSMAERISRKNESEDV